MYLHPIEGFRVGLFNDDIHKLLRPTPVSMLTKICKFQHKNGYNSGCITHITQIPAPVRGYSESAHLKVLGIFVQTNPVAMVTKNREF